MSSCGPLSPINNFEGARGNSNLSPDKLSIHEATFRGGEDQKQAYEFWAVDYEKDVDSLEYRGPRVGAEYVMKYTQHLESPKIIDLGAGTGLVAEEIFKLRPGYGIIDALDLSQTMLDEANKKGLYSKLLCEAMSSNMSFFEDSEYDAAVCIGTFIQGHVGPEAIRETLRTLKSGGWFVFSVQKSIFDAKWSKEIGDLMADGVCVVEEKVEFQYMKDVAGFMIVLSKW